MTNYVAETISRTMSNQSDVMQGETIKERRRSQNVKDE